MLKWFKRRERPQPVTAMLPIIPMPHMPMPDPAQEVVHRAMALNRAAKEVGGDIYHCTKALGALYRACDALAEHWYQQLYPRDDDKLSAVMEAELPQPQPGHPVRPTAADMPSRRSAPVLP